MATVYDLKEALKRTLQQQGTLDQLKATIRAEVFNVLNDDAVSPPKLGNANLLINELIREYAVFNNYKHTASVLTAETGLPKEAMSRDFLKSQINLSVDESQNGPVPLLYSMLEFFLTRKQVLSLIPPAETTVMPSNSSEEDCLLAGLLNRKDEIANTGHKKF